VILSQQDRENFSRLVAALGPWLDQIVVVGGWAYRFYRLIPIAQQLEYPPVVTLDADVALPSRLATADIDLRQRLLAQGFHEEVLGHHQPPVTHYHLGPRAGGFYVEFLTPLIGSPYKRNQESKSTMRVAGVVSQSLRHVDLLLRSPWLVHLDKTTEFPKSGSAAVQIANPVTFIAQKLLIYAKRPSGDQAKDILYIHDTIEIFGGSLERLRDEWHNNVRKHLPGKIILSINRTVKTLFQEVNDPIREAAIMAVGRRLSPSQIVDVCRIGLTRILS
jgi:hypothetical protein